MLDRGADVILVDVVGIRSLETFNHGFAKHGVDQAILTEVFPHTRPTGIAGEVNGG